MLQQICEYIHNYFIKTANVGDFVIDADGMISPLSLKEGQRFWITNSDLNDGVYTYHADGITNDDDNSAAGLRAESFAGTICAMAVPPAVIALAGEINDWVEKYGEAVESPYQSETFNGYSYSMKTGANGTGTAKVAGWQDIFADRLNRWRKIAV